MEGRSASRCTFSLKSVLLMVVVFLGLAAFILEFPFDYSPSLGGWKGFPLTYYEWKDYGPALTSFQWWNLILDLAIGAAVTLGLGYLFERIVVRRGWITDEAPPDSTRIIHTDTFLVFLAIACSVFGILFSILASIGWILTPSRVLWFSGQVFGLLLWTLAWRTWKRRPRRTPDTQ